MVRAPEAVVWCWVSTAIRIASRLSGAYRSSMIMQPPMTTAPPTRYVFDFNEPPPGSAEERLRLLGGKGANLVLMATDLGLPVPPGFVVTTEACRAFLAGSWPENLGDELHGAMDRLGDRVGRRFGDETDPLLVSVRSGAPVSMPGMMDTI